MADDRTKVSSLPLGDNLDDDDLLMTVEDGVSKKSEVGYLKTKFTEDLAAVSRSGSYNDLSNTPTIPDELADLTDDSTHRLVTDTEKSTWNAKQSALTFDDVPTDGSNNPVKSNGIYDALATKANSSDVPTALADLSDDSTHRVVTDTEKTTWNAKSDFSGSYNDLTDKPTIPSDADDISYDNTESGLTADDVQGAIDEVNGKIVGVEANPSGTATTELSKLKVGSTIYSTPNVYKVMSYDEEIAITYDTTYSYSYWFAQNNVATLNQQSATYKASVPIEVIPNETYSLTIKNFKSTYARAYFITDAQMNIISSSTSSTADETVTYNLTIPSNAKYLCISRKGTSVMPSLIHHVINANIPNTPDNIWKGKKWTCVGDSLTEVNQRASKRYYDYVSETTGISVVNMGESGTGYAMTNRNFYTRITNVPLDSDVITIFGSGNDLSAELDLGDPSDSGTSPTTLCGYINGTIDNLFDIFPLANIGIVTPSPWIYKTPDIPNNNLEKYSNAIVEICKRRSIPYLDLYHISGLHPDSEEFRELAYSKDEGNGVHPDETGHKILAPRFKAFLESLLL